MDTTTPGATENLWNSQDAEGLSDLEALAYRSNLLGRDRAVANYGGGNTSTKSRAKDHTGREVDVLWVKGSGSDLATIGADQFTGLKLDEVLPLMEKDSMNDEEMVAYLARCQLGPDMPRGSIETLLHAFVPHAQVDHTHPDAINMICCAEGGEGLARECFGEEAVWIPYIRPGFALSKQVGEAVKNNPDARFVLLAKHGLVTWGDTHEESYGRTIEAINRAAEFVASRADEPFGGRKVEPPEQDRREELLANVLPALRGALSSGAGESSHKILRIDHTTDEVLAFVCGRDSERLSQVGAACPDHLVRTKVRPLWIDFDPANEGPEELEAKLREGVARYREDYEAYFSRHEEADEEMFDPNPRVIFVSGVGLVAAAKNAKEANLSRDFAYRAINVMRGAHAVGGYVSLTEEESYAVEYWPLELYKLTLAPPPDELAGRVAFVTGGAGGIGGAVARTLASKGAFRIKKEQGIGGSIVFVASKNAMAAGKNAAAYSSAKAAELHLARCLAEEGGAERIRVNTVNPDAVLQGSRIWDSGWRETRAAAYGIEPDELEDYYRNRNVLKLNVLPENIAEAVLHFASEARSSRSTGNVLNVDGGVKDAYSR
jgi:rhamnulose-1-phosphate aldolase/alcohol dehydrogenase